MGSQPPNQRPRPPQLPPRTGEWPWLVTHDGHAAWYQRSFLVGDFAPGRVPIPNYVLELDGDLLGPNDRPRCGTCNAQPMSDDLEVVERATGNVGYLDRYRESRGRLRWPPPTKTTTCWYCNHPAPEKHSVDLKEFAEAVFYDDHKVKRSRDILVCTECNNFVARAKVRKKEDKDIEDSRRQGPPPDDDRGNGHGNGNDRGGR